MRMKIRRIVIFTSRMDVMTAFYRDVIGLELKVDDPGWKEFDAGGIAIGLHNGTSEVGRRPPKLVFYSDDVAGTREMLIERGATMGKVKSGKVKSGAGLDLCEGRDPDGNPFQISNRP